MRKYLLYIFLLSLGQSVFAQYSKTLYQDAFGRKTDDTDYHKRHLIESVDETYEHYKVTSYNKEGVLLAKYYISDPENLASNVGIGTEYYENGNVCAETNFTSSGERVSRVEWYADGQKKLEGRYALRKKNDLTADFIIDDFWDINKIHQVKQGNGYYKTEFVEGLVRNGQRDSIWRGQNENTKFSYVDTYENGQFIKGTSTDAAGKIYTYDQLEKQPYPKKGLQDFYNFIGKNIKVPRGVYGKISVRFVVEKDGSIAEVEIDEGLSKAADQAALKVVRKYADWVPGYQRGVAVRVMYRIPIKILPQQ